MYFPAGIPLLAVVALVIWNAHREAQGPKPAVVNRPKR
jgi:hypothetical protein